MGTLAVYGFLTAYALVAVALPIHLRRHRRLGVGGLLLSAGAAGATLLAMVGTVFPVPPAPLRYLPYVYAAYLASGMLWYALSRTWAAQREGAN
jgi:amino acid transporter